MARKKTDHQDDGVCQEVGLLWSGDHGVSLELGRQLEAHAQDFFNLPMEHKEVRNQELKYGYIASSPRFVPKKTWYELLKLSLNPAHLECFLQPLQHSMMKGHVKTKLANERPHTK